MSKTTLMVVGFVGVFLFSSVVMAEESTTTVREGGVVMSQEQVCRLVRQCETSSATATCQRARTGARQAWRRLLSRLGEMERNIRELQSRPTGVADSDNGALESDINQLREQLAEVRVELGVIARLIERLDRIEIQVVQNQADSERRDSELGLRIDGLERRLRDLDRRNGVVQLSVGGGATAIASFDGTLYTGGFVGVRLSLRVTRLLDVFVEPQFAFSGGRQPAGTVIRGGVVLEFIRGRLLLEGAVSGMWVGFNSQLDAHSAFLTADLGVEWRPVELIGLGVVGHMGIELDACDPSAALGASGFIRVNLPRW
jgi:hypothetical protein